MCQIKNIILLTIFTISLNNVLCQTVTNGNFSAGTASWGCAPETNPESVYGGPTGNLVAEVDQAAGLCQTISGFTIGSLYSLSFLCSRRTNCGPPTQSMNVSISGGALPATGIVRTGPWGFSLEQFNFTATSTSHVLSFVATIVGTCGLIVDNVTITLVSALPIQLLDFNCLTDEKRTVDCIWRTSSEINNHYFCIDKSIDGQNWVEHSRVVGAGNSTTVLLYRVQDEKPNSGITYYRLSQTDFDGKRTNLGIRSVSFDEDRNSGQAIEIYPNPTSDLLFVRTELDWTHSFQLISADGKDVRSLVEINELSKNQFFISTQFLPSGVYFLILEGEPTRFIKN